MTDKKKNKLEAELKRLVKRDWKNDFDLFREYYIARNAFDYVESGDHHREWAMILENKLVQDHSLDLEKLDHSSESLIVNPGDRENNKIIIEAPREHAKSSVFTVAYPLWELYRDQNKRIIIISSTKDVAESFLQEITQNLENNQELVDDLGTLIPERKEKWTDDKIIIQRDALYKDPSISVVGLGGAILSKRADIIILDDVLNIMNTQTQLQRQKTLDWFTKIIYPILVPGGRLVMIGTVFHENDLLETYLKSDSFDVKLKYKSIIDEENKIVLWEARHNFESLMDKKNTQGSVAFNLAYQNTILSDEFALIKRAWVEEAKNKGSNLGLFNSLEDVRKKFPGIRIVAGVDLQSSKKKTSDFFAIHIVGFLRNGMRITINLIRLQGLSMSEQEAYIIGQYEKFNPELVFVESNNYQVMLVRDLIEKTSLPVVSFTTTKEKHDLDVGINSLGVLLENGKWIIPSNNDTLQKAQNVEYLVNGLVGFDPDMHTEDLVMAMWFGNNAVRHLESNSGVDPVVEKVENDLYSYNSLEEDYEEPTLLIE